MMSDYHNLSWPNGLGIEIEQAVCGRHKSIFKGHQQIENYVSNPVTQRDYSYPLHVFHASAVPMICGGDIKAHCQLRINLVIAMHLAVKRQECRTCGAEAGGRLGRPLVASKPAGHWLRLIGIWGGRAQAIGRSDAHPQRSLGGGAGWNDLGLEEKDGKKGASSDCLDHNG